MTFKHKLVTAASAGSILAATLLPSAAFAVTPSGGSISNTGAGSVNKVKVNNNHSSTVKQKNNTIVSTGVFTVANTGKNKANKNVGGTSSVDTGDATNTVTVAVGGSTNTAEADSCGCVGHDTDASINNTGAGSYNKVKVNNTHTSTVKQTNNTVVETLIVAGSNTGGNSASKNVGGGSSVDSGDAETTVSVGVSGGSNEL